MGPIRRILLLAVLLLGTAGLGGCGDLTAPGDEGPVGLVVLDAEGREVASYDSRTGQVQGELSVPAGGTRSFRVLLTDRAGGETSPGAAGLTLSASPVNPNRASVEVEGDRLTVRGMQAGTTALDLAVREAGVSVLAAFVPVVVGAG